MTTLQLKCPVCGSAWVITKANGAIRICRKCGHQGVAAEFESVGQGPGR